MTLSITLVRPAGDFLTRLAIPVFCPVPLSTPLDPRRTRPADPLRRAVLHRLGRARTASSLLRNPNYAGSRPRSAARIVITDNTPTPKAVALVDRGRARLPAARLLRRPAARAGIGRSTGATAPGAPPPGPGAQRFFLHDRSRCIDTIVFNTRRPLFRNATAAAGGRSTRSTGRRWRRPTDDGPAAAGRSRRVPGFAAAGVYPLTGPDLRTARRLAGSAQRRAILLAPCDPTVVPAATILRSDLAKIGIAVEIPDAAGRATETPSRRRSAMQT